MCQLTPRARNNLVTPPPRHGLRLGAQSFGEFVALMAAMQALNAAAIDTMLPALPLIGRDFAVVEDNRLQWIVTAYVMGTGCGQLVYGPLSDRFGRRPRILLTAMCLYVVLSLLTSLAPDLNALVALRVLQGFSVAATSVVSRSVVRDCYSGEAMARVHVHDLPCIPRGASYRTECGSASPAIRELARCIWISCALGVVVAVWAALRLPGALNAKNRRSLGAAHLLQAARFVLTHPTSILYTMSLSLMFGSLLAYVSTVPQIIAGVSSRAQSTGAHLRGVCGCDGRRDICKRTPCRATRDAPDITFRACSVYSGHIRTRRDRLVRHRVFADLCHSAVDHDGLLSPRGIKLWGHSDAAHGVDRGQRCLFARRHQYDRRCRSRFPHRSSMVRVRILSTSGFRVLRGPGIRPGAHG